MRSPMVPMFGVPWSLQLRRLADAEAATSLPTPGRSCQRCPVPCEGIAEAAVGDVDTESDRGLVAGAAAGRRHLGHATAALDAVLALLTGNDVYRVEGGHPGGEHAAPSPAPLVRPPRRHRPRPRRPGPDGKPAGRSRGTGRERGRR